MAKIHVTSDGAPANTHVYLDRGPGMAWLDISGYVRKVNLSMSPEGIVADIEATPPALDIVAMMRSVNGEGLEGMIERQADTIVDLRSLLIEALDLHRSTLSIAERQGRQTNWEAFTRRVKDILERGHTLLHRGDVTRDRVFTLEENKKRFESDILDLIKKFEERTGVYANAVEVERVTHGDMITGMMRPVRLRVVYWEKGK